MKKLVLASLMLIFATVFTFGSAHSKPKIGMKKARAIALKRAPGRVESGELEKEHGRWIYSFDIRNSKGTITEVQVNAYSGKVVSAEEETAKQEADEKKAEKTKH
jgi:hypothetical protein